LAAEIREAFPDARVEMIPSGGGRFEVTCDGRAVFQKSKLGRHAAPGEIVRLLRAATAG
jgi:selT/selW/selH-like putative selenoprotein